MSNQENNSPLSYNSEWGECRHGGPFRNRIAGGSGAITLLGTNIEAEDGFYSGYTQYALSGAAAISLEMSSKLS